TPIVQLFPITTLFRSFLMVINLIYFILYFQLHSKNFKIAMEKRRMENELKQENFLFVKQGNQTIQIPNSSIAYFILKNKLTILRSEEHTSELQSRENL